MGNFLELLLLAQPTFPGQRKFQIVLAVLFVITVSLVSVREYGYATIVFFIDAVITLLAWTHYKRSKLMIEKKEK